jgi:glutathione peroxidase
MLRKAFFGLLALGWAVSLTAKPRPKPSPVPTPTQEALMGVHQFTVQTIDGQPKSLADYKGKVLLIVNVASECGFTPQYEGLEALYEKYRDRGFVILGFPSNDFGGQEPGTEAEIKAFCNRNYNVSFDLFAKVHAKTMEGQAPLFQWLTTNGPSPEHIGWNFNKFLIAKDGSIIKHYGSNTKPLSDELTAAVEQALK